MISRASLSLHSWALCPPLSTVSSCHVTSYLLGLQGHCLSDWQSSDSTQYPNNPRAWRRSRLTAWQHPLVGRVTASERRSEKRTMRETNQRLSFNVITSCQNHGQQVSLLLGVSVNLTVISIVLHFYWKWLVYLRHQTPARNTKALLLGRIRGLFAMK